MFFSIIIPVFNRPDEIRELLSSISNQDFLDFEVIVVEDGSPVDSEEICRDFESSFSLCYIFQENSGQGFARNHGMTKAQGEFFIILDSDVVLPSDYLGKVYRAIQTRKLDAFGGPDAADSDFSALQKAMDFAMTSFWTTGGIRGKLKNPSKYQARGFNMGVARRVFEQIGGFVDPNQGEDVEWSIRIKKAGFKLELVEEAFVYHKRKNTLTSFAKQAFSFGRNRVNVSRFHPEAIQLVHWLPTVFLLFLISIPFFFLMFDPIAKLELMVLGFWSMAVLISSGNRFGSLLVTILSWTASIIQLVSYGAGLLVEKIKKSIVG
ncbi:glycosyltransferase [Algoriphagus confluentis]|uniref:Glycosyltransferase n=1 Tax=Algoriphagus confluentis TaxID=1697556 RepID=A0ABQ6PR47_9BACT|nr:glycosyltransferase [Algoriphagus confluentis]